MLRKGVAIRMDADGYALEARHLGGGDGMGRRVVAVAVSVFLVAR